MQNEDIFIKRCLGEPILEARENQFMPYQIKY